MNEIFIFAQKRSGSTLLQRAINQTPGVTIYGEHGGMLQGFAAAYYQALETGLNDVRFSAEVLRKPDSFAPCYSGIDPFIFKRQMRNFVEGTFHPRGGTLRWGFKEVRYTDKVFELLAEIFPTAKFIFLVRDPREQIQSVMSMRWEGFDSALKYWLNTFSYFDKCTKAMPARCRMLHYENLRNVKKTFDWLGLDSPLKNLFRQMPVTGETENKQPLTWPHLQAIEHSGALDLFINFVWNI